MDENAVWAEIQNRKARAKELGVDKLVTDLFLAHHVYEQRADATAPEDALTFVEEIRRSPDGALHIVMANREYVVSNESSASEDGLWQRITITAGGRLLFELTAVSHDPDGFMWKPVGVGGFFEDQWVEDFTRLHAAVVERERKRRQKWASDRLAKERVKFGI